MPFLACISQGQLSLVGDGGGEIVESPFGRSLRERAVQIYNRHAWKTQGRGGQSLSRALHTPAEPDPWEFRIAITSVTRGARPGELLYTLETDEISGVFSRDADGLEKRLFHTADFRARHLDMHPAGDELALSVSHHNGMENLAVLKADGSSLIEVTDGDSIDQAPRWAPGPVRRLVFQSSGMGRDRAGRLSGRGPYSVQQLDLEGGGLQCLAEDPAFDFLAPRFAPDGAVYYIRRPHPLAPKPPSPSAALLQTVLMPFRILWVIGKLIDLSVERRTGTPLFGPPSAPTAQTAVRTPSDWVLMRHSEAGLRQAGILAEGVRSFDFASNGSILYSNGFDVYRLPAEGGPAVKILAADNIDSLTVL